MTQEEIAKVKAMSREERRRHFKPLFMANKITFKEYEAIITLTLSPSHVEISTDAEESRLDDEETAITELARQFGGYVIPNTPKREQGGLVTTYPTSEKERQIQRNIMSG